MGPCSEKDLENWEPDPAKLLLPRPNQLRRNPIERLSGSTASCFLHELLGCGTIIARVPNREVKLLPVGVVLVDFQSAHSLGGSNVASVSRLTKAAAEGRADCVRAAKKTGSKIAALVVNAGCVQDFFFFSLVSMPGASSCSASRPCLACWPYVPLGSSSTAFWYASTVPGCTMTSNLVPTCL